MKVFDELIEIEETQDKLKDMTNDILDLYNLNPEKSKKLLIELSEIEKELNELEGEFKKILNEV
jgi:hypothetical protein